MTGPFYVRAKPHLEPWYTITYLVHHLFSLPYTQVSSSSSLNSASVDLAVVIFHICLLFFWCTTGVHPWNPSLEKANPVLHLSSPTPHSHIQSSLAPYLPLHDLEDPQGMQANPAHDQHLDGHYLGYQLCPSSEELVYCPSLE